MVDKTAFIKYDRGDYLIHVFIQSGRKFINQKEQSLSPLISVIIDGQKQQTDQFSVEVLCNADELTKFNKHFYFELKDQQPEEIQEKKILIQILNCGFLRDQVVGQFEETVPAIYGSANHTAENQWVAFNKPDSETPEEITGVMKISFQVTGPNDVATLLAEQDPRFETANNIKLPSSIKRQGSQLRIMILETKDIDSDGQKPIIYCDFGAGRPQQTSIQGVSLVKGKKSFIINQVMLIPLLTPITNDRLKMEIRCQGGGLGFLTGTHLFVGYLTFSLKEILAASKDKQQYGLHWCNIYGAKNSNTSDDAKMQYEIVHRASYYKGSVLVHISLDQDLKDGEYAKKDVMSYEKDDVSLKFYQQIYPETKEKGKIKPKEDEQYMAMINLDQGISLPQQDVKYKVKFCIGKESWKSKVPKEQKGTYCRWSQRIKNIIKTDQKSGEIKTAACIFFFPKTAQIKDQRLFVYLLDENDKQVCYWSQTLDKFLNEIPKVKWIQMMTNKFEGGPTDDYLAGMLGIQVQIKKMEFLIPAQLITGGAYREFDVQKDLIIPLNKNIEFFTKNILQKGKDGKNTIIQPCWAKKSVQRMKAWKVRCFVFQCKNLPSSDPNGSSDPFIRIWNPDGDQIETNIVVENCSPIFMRCLEFYFDFQDAEDAQPILIDAFDADKNWLGEKSQPEFLGRAVVRLQSTKKKPSVQFHNQKGFDDTIVPEPEYHDFKFDPVQQQTCGKVLCSFHVVPADHTFTIDCVNMKKKMNDIIKRKNFQINLGLLSLRNLESTGLLPIQRATLKVKISQIFPVKMRHSCEDITTQAQMKGPNPNINYFLDYYLSLPIEEKYIPDLSCLVQDQIFAWGKPDVVGSFIIDIAKLIKISEQKRTEQEENLKKFITHLKTLLKSDPIVTPIENINTARNSNKKQSLLLDEIVITSKQVQQNQKEYQKPRTVILPEYEQDQDYHIWKLIEFPTVQRENSAFKILPEEFGLKYMKVGYNNQAAITKYKNLKENLEKQNEGQCLTKLILSEQDKIQFKTQMDQYITQDNLQGNNAQFQMLKHQFTHTFFKNETDEKEEEPTKKAPAKIRSDLIYKLQNQTNLHFRQIIDKELEEVIQDGCPFVNIKIFNGQSRGSLSIFSSSHKDASGSESNLKEVGYFKGLFSIVEANTSQKTIDYIEKITQLLNQLLLTVKSEIKLSPQLFKVVHEIQFIKRLFDHFGYNIDDKVQFLLDRANYKLMNQNIMRKQNASFYLYIVKAYEIAKYDLFSASDPYLKVLIGNQVLLNDRDNYQLDKEDCTFNKIIFYNSLIFPGTPLLNIEIYDYDEMFGDELIGRTKIDMDDRYFNYKWQDMEEKPIETRKIMNPSSKSPQAKLNMWLDIFQGNSSGFDVKKQQNDKEQKLPEHMQWLLETEPSKSIELRVCVISCDGLPAMDIEGTNDAYIKAFIENEDGSIQACETDTHYRCNNGSPSFNYRLKFNIKTPFANEKSGFQLHLQAYDRDLFTKNDMICQWTIYIHDIVNLVKEANMQIKVSEQMMKTSQASSIRNGTNQYTPIYEKPTLRDTFEDKKTYIDFQKETSIFHQDTKLGKFCLCWCCCCRCCCKKKIEKFEQEDQQVQDDTFNLITQWPIEDKKYQCKIKLDLRILTKEQAETKPAGIGRESPNVEPFMGPPAGRLSLANPLSFLTSMCSKQIQMRICIAICCLIMIAFVCYVTPTFLTNMIAIGVTKLLSQI